MNGICIDFYFKTPIHSVSSVLVDQSLALESSEPVTSMDPSSERAMQFTLSSWSPGKPLQNEYKASSNDEIPGIKGQRINEDFLGRQIEISHSFLTFLYLQVSCVGRF